jgi:Lycopene cyclase
MAIWAAVYASIRNRQSRREMLTVSLWTSLLGLTEFLFVPAYWTPPSLFDLARKTHFDIESLLFSFAIGGLAVVIYEWFFPVRHLAMSSTERHLPRHRFHILALLSAPVIFVLLATTTNLNPIYSTILALAGGGICACYCRPDLIPKMLSSAILFLGLYFAYFLSLVTVYPDYVREVWNLRVISGILVLGVPLEELLFAFTLGFTWSSIYEHLKWQRVRLLDERLPLTVAHQ